MMRRCLCAALVVAVLCCLCFAVVAHPVPDFSKTGTIQVSLKKGDEIAAGGTVSLYRVADIVPSDGDYIFQLTESFVESNVSLEDPMASGIADQLKAFAQSKELPAVTLNVDAEGNVVFADLELGLYLVVQQTPASGWNPAAPFLVSVPQQVEGEYVYQIDASPKVELEKAPPPPTVPDDPKLPQTGQLNWPVPVMAICGLLLVLVGCILCMHGRKVKQ